MTLIWVGISIILAINSMVLLKLNKDLAQVNDELIEVIKNAIEDYEEDDNVY